MASGKSPPSSGASPDSARPGWLRGLQQWMAGSHFMQPYYVLHAIVFVVFGCFYMVVSEVVSDERAAHLRDWEFQALCATTLGVAVGFVKQGTLVPGPIVVTDVLKYLKLTLLALGFMLDPRVCAWLGLLFVVLYLVYPLPAGVLPGQGVVPMLTPSQIQQRVLSPQPKGTCWLICCGASFSLQSVLMDHVLEGLARRYSTPLLHFGKVDVGRFPDLAAEWGINVGQDKQLPTLLLFEDSEEVKRIPRVLPDGSVPRRTFNKQALVQHFELDMRFTRTRASVPRPTAAGAKAKVA